MTLTALMAVWLPAMETLPLLFGIIVLEFSTLVLSENCVTEPPFRLATSATLTEPNALWFPEIDAFGPDVDAYKRLFAASVMVPGGSNSGSVPR